MSDTQKKNHLPFAIVYFLFYAFSLFMQLKDALFNYSPLLFSQWNNIFTFIACLVIIVALALRKKGVFLFISVTLFALIRIAGFLSGLISGNFSLGAIVNLLAFLFFVFYVGTVCIEPLKQYHEKVKKLYFIPGLVFVVLALVQVIPNLNLSLIVNAFLVPSAFHLVAFWCSGKSTEKGPSAAHAQRLFFFALAIVIAVAMGLMYFPKEAPKKEESNNSYDSAADYIKDQDPDLYNDIVDRYDSAVQDYNNSNNKNSGGSSYGSSSGSSSNKKYGAGGYEMPNENDKSFSDYVKRVDPDLYNDMVNNYNNAVGY